MEGTTSGIRCCWAACAGQLAPGCADAFPNVHSCRGGTRAVEGRGFWG